MLIVPWKPSKWKRKSHKIVEQTNLKLIVPSQLSNWKRQITKYYLTQISLQIDHHTKFGVQTRYVMTPSRRADDYQ